MSELFKFKKPGAMNTLHFIMDKKEAIELVSFYYDYDLKEAIKIVDRANDERVTRMDRKYLDNNVERIIKLDLYKVGLNEEGAKVFISNTAEPLGYTGNVKDKYYAILTADGGLDP